MIILHIILTSLLFLISTAIGLKLINKFALNITGKSHLLIFSNAIGLVILANFAATAGFLGLIYKPIFILALLLLSFLCRTEIIYILAYLKTLFINISGFNQNRFSRILLLIFLTAASFNLFFSYTPPTGVDELVYHLSFPKIFLENHRIIDIPDNYHSYFPLNAEMLFIFGLILGGGLVSKLISYSFGILVAICIYLFTKQYLKENTAILAAVIYYLSTALIGAAGLCNTDVIFNFFCFISFWGILYMFDKKDNNWIYLISFSSAMAITVKLVSIPLIPVIILFLIYYFFAINKSSFLKASKFIIIFLLINFICIFPWILRNYIYTGSPFPLFEFPFNFPINEMFKMAIIDNRIPFSYSFSNILNTIVFVFLGPTMISFGPLTLVFSLPIIFFKDTNKTIKTTIVFLLLFTVMQFLMLPDESKNMGRFYFFSFSLLCIISAYVIDRMKHGSLINTLVLIPIIFPGLILSLYFGGKRLPVVFGLTDKDTYIIDQYEMTTPDDYKMVRYINGNVLKSKNVLYFGVERFVDSYYPVPRVFAAQPDIYNIDNFKSMDRELKKMNIDYIVIITRNFSLSKDGKYYINKLSPFLKLYYQTVKGISKKYKLIHSEPGIELYRVT